jgi:hypothetical protein
MNRSDTTIAFLASGFDGVRGCALPRERRPGEQELQRERDLDVLRRELAEARAEAVDAHRLLEEERQRNTDREAALLADVQRFETMLVNAQRARDESRAIADAMRREKDDAQANCAAAERERRELVAELNDLFKGDAGTSLSAAHFSFYYLSLSRSRQCLVGNALAAVPVGPM